MSELKAFDVGLGQYTEDGYPCVVAFDADQNPRLLGDEKVYLKSEADRYIAHQKYKRCLGLAAVCFEKSYSTTLLKYDKKSDLFRNFYDWWGNRWLELSEKFKEGV